MRNDIFGHLALNDMSMEQLAFRRNGVLHDISDHHRRGTKDMREQVARSQSHLAEVDAAIAERLKRSRA